MITLREVGFGVFGAWRLARLEPTGMRYFDTSIDGFWRSFFAALVVAPGYLVVMLLRHAAQPVAAHPVRVALLEAIGYAIGWTLYPLVAFYLCRAFDVGGRYLGYIVAYNWANVIQAAIYVPAVIVGGLLVSGPGLLLGLAVMVAILYYQYFIARAALGVGAAVALVFVAVDFATGMALHRVIGALLAR
ncbi:MAG: hypothetical protein ACT4P2_16730 [Pseudomonadota bacterium]